MSFHLFIVSFTMQKLLSLSRYICLFYFYFHYSGRWIKKVSPWVMSESVLPMFSCRILIVLVLTFRSLSHFELIFVYGGKEWSNLIFSHVAVQFSQHHLWKRLSLLLFSWFSDVWLCATLWNVALQVPLSMGISR